MNDDAKKVVLARRARFLAAAVAGIGIACGKEKATPQPCLDVAPEHDAAATSPAPCLSVAPVSPPPPALPPSPCLSIATYPDASSPRPCLTPARRHDAGCDPAYEIDHQGRRTFKKECL